MIKLSTDDINSLLVSRNLRYVSGFLDSRYSFNVVCLDCQYVFSTNLYVKSGCKNCKLKKEFNYYINIIDKLGFQYISGTYQNKNSQILVTHKLCEYSFFTNIKRIIRGDGCARCSKKEKPSLEQISNIVSLRHINIISTSYKNSHTKLVWECSNCGFIWKSTWDNIREGHGCPNCNKLVGNKNPNWRGGLLSKYPTEWNRTLKEFIRNRDRRRCQFPGCIYTDTESKKLHVHHINGIKNNCSPNNLISLCNSHHQYVERHNPRDWEDYFYSITNDYEVRK